MDGFTDWRVLYQHNNPERTDPQTGRLLTLAEGPVFAWITVLARDADEAAEQVALIHWNDVDFEIVQVFPSNGAASGFGDTRAGNEAAHG
jgi:hypothetical protein